MKYYQKTAENCQEVFLIVSENYQIYPSSQIGPKFSNFKLFFIVDYQKAILKYDKLDLNEADFRDASIPGS